MIDLAGLDFKRDQLRCPSCGKWRAELVLAAGGPICRPCLRSEQPADTKRRKVA